MMCDELTVGLLLFLGRSVRFALVVRDDTLGFGLGSWHQTKE